MTDLKLIAIFVVFMLAAFGSGIVVGQSIHATPAAAVDNCNTTAPVTVYDRSFNGTAVNVPLDSEFLVSLPENGGSTGYVWDPTSTQGLDLLESKFIPGNKSLIGAPGTRQWLFRASWAGEQQFKATLHRPWENLTGSEEVFMLTIIVS